MEMYMVGGVVRDEILGVKSKDIDFSVVLSNKDFINKFEDPFTVMHCNLLEMGFDIFLATPEFLTIRARFPKDHPTFPRMAADFVLARSEGTYTDGRRPDAVQVGSLQDDLARRDFTMNAIAKDSNGNLIDPFNGRADIEAKIIRCVGSAHERIIREDALRGMRALRFSVTKGFEIDSDIRAVLKSSEFREAIQSISTERISDELEKMFKVDTAWTIRLLHIFGLIETLFDNTGLRLMPTMKA